MARPLTEKVNLVGRQDRLVQMILHVCQQCASAKFFGRVKLNKILWKADFLSFRERGVPVTGRAYQRLPQGPAPKEMLPVLSDMLRNGSVVEERTDFGNGKVQRRPVSTVPANLSNFSKDDLAYVQIAIDYYWEMTGTESSDDSHGAAWSTRNDGDPMPYESAYLLDVVLSDDQLAKIKTIIDQRQVKSQ